MMKNIRKLICILISLEMFCSVYAAGTSISTAAFVQGCNAYASGDWREAVFMLKKAVSYQQNNNPETYYMLISAELSAGENSSALLDCNYFFENFSDSIYISQVQYLKGRILYNLGEYENAIVELSDFCHQYETHNMYPIALYWIGEALFSCEKYEQAQSVFERLILDYPDNVKVAAAQYKIESIAQREREEKLLYLLKQTGEEYLAAKEDYEKQLRLHNSQSAVATRQKLTEEQKKNEDLEEKIKFMEEQIEQLKKELALQKAIAEKMAVSASAMLDDSILEEFYTSANYTPVPKTQNTKSTRNTSTITESNPESLRILKEKALQAQKLLDSKNEEQ